MKLTQLASYRKKAEKVQFWIQFLAQVLALAIQFLELAQLISSAMNQ